MFRQIRKRLPPWGTCRNFLIGGSILVGLHALSRYNDLLFHSFAGIVGVLMVWAVLRHWKHADEALQQQRQFLETVIDSVQDGILACDAGGNLIFHNRAFRKLHRLPPGLTVAEAGQALPDTLYRSLYRSDGRTPLGKEDAPLDRVLRGEQVDNFELVVVPLGGPPTTVLVSGRPLVGQHDENLGGVVAIRDITARKRAEEMLRDRERHQALLLKRLEGINRLQEELLLPGPIEEKFKKITDAAVTLLDLDFCRVWRVKPGDLCKGGCLHAEAQDEIHACRRRDKCLHLLASSGRYTSIDGTHRRVPLGCNKIGRVATGKSKRFLTNSVGTDPQVADHQWAISLGLVSFAGYKLRAARNDATGVLAAFARHTISEEDNAFLAQLAETTSKIILDSQVQDELRQSQKLEAVGSLAGGIAHEFNNLLQAIGGYAHCAMEGLPCGEQRYGDLQQVVKAADRAAVLTRQLLGFSRRSVAQCKHLDPNAAVADLAKLVRPLIGADVDLETILGAELGTVYADPAGLQQVLLNLCLNARDAMPSGGKLLLQTDRVVLGEALWEHEFEVRPGPYVVFSVTDTGCGMPPEVRRRIFEPFFTTKEVGKGTGLGLPMVYGIVRQHQGVIHVYSEPQRGTTFRIYLPVASDAESPPDAARRPAVPRGHETLLLAEDEPMVQSFAVRVLQGAGYTVLAASDGEQAVRLFQEHAGEISLLILDALMPKLTGPEVYRRIASGYPGTKVIFCSAFGLAAPQTSSLLEDGLRLIEKPFDAETLLSTVRQALDEKRAESPPSLALQR